MKNISFTFLSLIFCLSLCACSHTPASKYPPNKPERLSDAAILALTDAVQTHPKPTPEFAPLPAGEVILKDNLSRLQPLRRLGEGTFNYEFDLSADDSLLAVTDAAGIMIYDARNGKRLRLIQTPAATGSVAFSADGKLIAAVYRLPSEESSSETSSDNELADMYTTLGVWQVADGTQIFQRDLRGTNCGEHSARQLSFSQDGRQISFVESLSMRNAGEWRNLCIYAAQDGHLIEAHDLRQTDSGERFADAVYSGDLRKTAIAIGKDILILDDESHTETRITTDVHPTVMAFSPDGTSLAFSGYGDEGSTPYGQLQIISPADSRTPQVLTEAKEMLLSIAWSADGQWIAGGTSLGLAVWKTNGEIALQTEPITFADNLSNEIPGSIWNLAFSPAGDVLYGLVNSSTAGVTAELRAWHVPDGKPVFTLSDHIGVPAAFSPDSRLVALGGYGDGRVQVWDAVSGELVNEWQSGQGLVYQTAFSPDGTFLLSAGEDGSLGVWETQTGNQVGKWQGHEPGIFHMAISPQGDLIASASKDGKIIIREFPSGNATQTLDFPKPWIPEVLVFTADGQDLLMGWNLYNQISGYRGQWSLWNRQTKEIRALANTWPVAAFSDARGGNYAVWTEDSRIMFGEFSSGRLSALSSLRSPRGNGALGGYAISPDGSLLLSGNAFGLHVWNLPDSQPILIQQTKMGGYPYGILTFNPDGSLLAISNDSSPLTIWGIAP